jgi:hypothetical protein
MWKYPASLLVIFLVFANSGLYGQAAPDDTSAAAPVPPATTADPQDIIGANVFTLDTRNPSVLTVYSNYRNGKPVVVPRRKLEMSASQTSAFRIININPLRYNYYLNGQLVTQFMDSSPAAAGGELTGVPEMSEIISLDVFTMDKEALNQKLEIDKAKEELKELQKKVEAAQQELWPLMDSLNDAYKANAGNKKLNALNQQYVKKYRQWEYATAALNSKLADLNLMVNKLAINANSVSIITGLQKSLGRHARKPMVKYTIGRMNYYIDEYLRLDQVCRYIRQELNELPHQTERTESYQLFSSYARGRHTAVDTLLTSYLMEIGYPVKNMNKILSSTDPKVVLQQDLETFRIEEYMTDRKIAALGNLLTALYMEVGKLLQDGHLELSLKLGEIRRDGDITPEDAAVVKTIADQIDDIFGTIQIVNAHISVLTTFMQINNPQSRDLGKKIITNYKTLLELLKTTDFIKDGTTSKYTLAMHANGANVDLIRYTVTQEDKLNKTPRQSYNYDIWLKGGLKIDFSVGIFATGLTDHAYEKKALLVNSDSGPQPSDTAFSLGRKDHGKYGFAFGGMVNISPRMGASWITPGISLGVAYGDSQNLQFIAAGSLHMGKSERILLHAGCVMGMAKVLDRSAITYTDDTNKYVSGDIANYPVPMADKFQGKFIFGISYNLSKKNALQAVSGQGLTKFNSNMDAVQ